MEPLVSIYQGYVDCLTHEDSYRRAYDSMPGSRKQRIGNYPTQPDKRLCCGSWMMLRWALNREGISTRHDPFFRDPAGKPHLIGKLAFFNLSHSGNAALCAISRTAEVGCDVQRMEELSPQVLRACMTPAEIASIAAQEPAQQRRAFFRRWAIKESYLKMRGVGLTEDPRSLQVMWDAAPSQPPTEQGFPRPRIYDSATGKPLPCSVTECFLDDDSCYAVCANVAQARFILTEDAVPRALDSLPEE